MVDAPSPEKFGEAVKKLAGDDAEPEEKKLSVDGKPSKSGRALMQQPTSTIQVERIRPRKFMDRSIVGLVETFRGPMSPDEVYAEIAQGHGGGKYRVAVYEPDNPDPKYAYTIEIAGEPIIHDLSGVPEPFPELKAKEAAGDDPPPEIELQRKIKILEKKADYIRALREYRSILGAEDGEKKSNPEVAAIRTELERLRAEMAKQVEDARMQALKAEIQSLKDLVNKPQNSDNERFALILQQMDRNMQSQIEMFRLLLKNHPAGGGGGGDLGGQISALRELMALVGLAPGEQEPRSWIDRLIDHVPGILEALQNRKNQGESLTKEVFREELEKAKKKIESEAVQTVRQTLLQKALAAQQQQAQPAPAPAQTVSAPAQAAQAAQPNPAASAVTAPPEPAIKVPVDQDIRYRVNSILAIVEREMALRVRGARWPEAAWLHLPGDLLDQVCRCSTPDEFFSALAPYMDQAKFGSLLDKIKSDPKNSEWFRLGLEWLKDAMRNPEGTEDDADDIFG